MLWGICVMMAKRVFCEVTVTFDHRILITLWCERYTSAVGLTIVVSESFQRQIILGALQTVTLTGLQSTTGLFIVMQHADPATATFSYWVCHIV